MQPKLGGGFVGPERSILSESKPLELGKSSEQINVLCGEAFDELQPGDETEIYRVATSAGQVIDTNFDNDIDSSDRRAIFDANGKEVGITLFESLDAVGLTRYDARDDEPSH